MSKVHINATASTRLYTADDNRTVSDILGDSEQQNRQAANSLCLHRDGNQYGLSQHPTNEPRIMFRAKQHQQFADFLIGASQTVNLGWILLNSNGLPSFTKWNPKRFGINRISQDSRMFTVQADSGERLAVFTPPFKTQASLGMFYVLPDIVERLIVDLHHLAGGRDWDRLDVTAVSPKHELVDLQSTLLGRRPAVHP